MKPKTSPTKIQKSNNPKTNIDRTAGLPIEMKDYLSELGELRRSINYIRVTTYALQKFNKSCNGIDVLTVNDDTIKKFLKDLNKEQLGDRTVTDYIRSIARFYSFLIETRKYGLIFNPVTRLSKRLNNKRQQTKRPIKTPEEIAKLIKGIHNPRDRAIVILLAKTAIRNGEMVALNVEDIDFDKETININKHIADHTTNAIKKGRKNGNETLIPLDDETLRALKFYLKIRKNNIDGALFISNNGNRLYAQDIIRIVKEWSVKTKTCIETTDIEKKIVPHFFRAWATYTLQIAGLNPSIVDYIRGDVANSIRGFYFNQVLPFEVIKKDYLKAVPKFGI
jgi:integrase